MTTLVWDNSEGVKKEEEEEDFNSLSRRTLVECVEGKNMIG